MIFTKVEEKEAPSKDLFWFKVIVIGENKKDEKKVFEEGKRIHWVLRKLQVLGFRVNNGLPVKADFSYYFFIVECPLKNKDRTREAIKEVAEAGEGLYQEY